MEARIHIHVNVVLCQLYCWVDSLMRHAIYVCVCVLKYVDKNKQVYVYV